MEQTCHDRASEPLGETLCHRINREASPPAALYLGAPWPEFFVPAWVLLTKILKKEIWTRLCLNDRVGAAS